jgi:hypothetical protein
VARKLVPCNDRSFTIAAGAMFSPEHSAARITLHVACADARRPHLHQYLARSRFRSDNLFYPIVVGSIDTTACIISAIPVSPFSWLIVFSLPGIVFTWLLL